MRPRFPAFQVNAINRRLQSCTLSCMYFLAQGALRFFEPKGTAAADQLDFPSRGQCPKNEGA